MIIGLTSERFLGQPYAELIQRSNVEKNVASWRWPLLQSVRTLSQAAITTEGRTMQKLDDTGCLTQRSQLERLRELADGIVQERIKDLASPNARLATVLIVIGAAAKETTWDVESLASSGARLGRGTQWLVDPEAALANFVPTQAIMRILRETDATAAAIVAPIAAAAVAMQLADDDHEQSLTARLVRQPDASPTLGKWDFGSVLWAVRLRQMLLASRRPTATVPTRPVAAQPGIAATVSGGRRGQKAQMREQLHGEAAAAASWIQ
jgi:hypothetical protein